VTSERTEEGAPTIGIASRRNPISSAARIADCFQNPNWLAR